MNTALEAIKARFRARCVGDRQARAAAVQAGDAPVARAPAHKLAGAAGTFGFQALSEAALLLEDQLAYDDPPDPELVAVLDRLLASVGESARA